MRCSRVLREMKAQLMSKNISFEAEKAIQAVIEKLLAEDICTIKEFISLIDLDCQDDWIAIADKMAQRLEEKIRSDLIHPNDFKPWHYCQNYKVEFGKIENLRAWRSAHGAINSILKCLDARFSSF